MAKEATRNAYGKALAELVVERDDVLVLDADLTKSTKTIDAKKARPEHHFNMGIAEGNMMAVAAGMAASNKVVYASSFAMFAAGRAFEQIRNSICYPNLNVKVCATHAGITVGEDGASHQCIEDIALMRSIPNMKVFVPCDQYQAKAIVKAVADIAGPCYVRLGRGAVEDGYDENYKFELGKGKVLREGQKVALVATGMMVQEALKAADILSKEGILVTVVDMPCIKPIDEELIEEIAKSHEIIITCEEHNVYGGLGSAVSEVTSKKSPVRMEMMGMQDTFGESGTPNELLAKYGLNADHIVEKVMSLKTIKLIVADLDGTLLHDDKSLDRNIKSVLIEKNVPLTFVSGRNVHIIQDYIKELNITLPYITNNGANMFLGDTCIYECPIDSSELKTCLNILVANKVALLAYTNQTIYSVGYQEGLDAFKNRLIGKCEIVEDANIEDIVRESIFKVVMIHPNMERVKDQLNSVCDKTVCMQSEGIIYTLTNKDSTKGKTLLKLLKYLDMEPSSVLAFGDNYNDISMFEVVDGVAVENAQESLKEVAKYLTKSNEDDGVSYFIQNKL